jgi:DNA-binding NarL/FixJ family response regulator
MNSPFVIRILVVEDNSFWQEIIVRKLQEQDNLQVTAIVADGLEAVHNAEELQPDLMLLDIGLPRLNGIEVAKRVRKLAPAVRILFVSADSCSDIIRDALRIGALGYVHKPNVGSDLLPTIQAVLEGEQFVGQVDTANLINHGIG